ncbi:MAG: thiolase family protein [Haloarculaceae archaeon]
MTFAPDVVVGAIGETEKSRARADRGEDLKSVEEYFREAASLTLEGTGLSKDDVDGLGVVIPNQRETARYADNLAELLGFEDIDWLTVAEHGGASPTELLLQGALAVQQGVTETMLCLGADTPKPPEGSEALPIPAPEHGFETNYMAPFGYQGPNSRVALVQNRYEHEHGIEPEQLGKIAVASREHATHNPLAYQDEPITIDEYLDSPILSDPIRLLDAVIPVNAGYGFLLSRAGNADALDGPPVRIETYGKRMVNADTSRRPDVTTTGIARATREAFATSDLTVEAMDFYQLYDNYPISVVLQLEDVGLCAKGEGGAFVERTDLSYDGDVPLNTGGGQHSSGQTGRAGGFTGINEAVRQLTGRADGRQVPDASVGLLTGLGGLSYEKNYQHTTTVVLERGDDR